MKKEIMALIASKEGKYVLNNISCLRRWTKSALGEDVDRLGVEFSNINHVNFKMSSKEIVSRKYNEIIDEITTATQEYLNAISVELCKNLKSGYRNAE